MNVMESADLWADERGVALLATAYCDGVNGCPGGYDGFELLHNDGSRWNWISGAEYGILHNLTGFVGGSP
jgi:hypothetical protein